MRLRNSSVTGLAVAVLLLTASNIAICDVPGDSCVAFVLDTSAARGGEKLNNVLRGVQSLAVCSTSNEISRVFGRTKPRKVANGAECTIYETAITLHLSGELETGRNAGQKKAPASPTTYMAKTNELGDCPVSTDAGYVIVNDVDAIAFRDIANWWSCVQKNIANDTACESADFKGITALGLLSAIRDGSASLQGIGRSPPSTGARRNAIQYTLRVVVYADNFKLYLLRLGRKNGVFRLSDTAAAIL